MARSRMNSNIVGIAGFEPGEGTHGFGGRNMFSSNGYGAINAQVLQAAQRTGLVSKIAATMPQESGISQWWGEQSTGAKAGVVIGAAAVLGILGYFVYDTFYAPQPGKARPNRRRKQVRGGSNVEKRRMREMLSSYGIPTKYAQTLMNRGIGVDELPSRVKQAYDGHYYVPGLATPNGRRANRNGYGDKRNYPKIDIYVRGKYVSSTTWAPTLKAAKSRFLQMTSYHPDEVRCHYATPKRSRGKRS